MTISLRTFAFLAVAGGAMSTAAAERCLPEYFEEGAKYGSMGSPVTLVEIDEASCWVLLDIGDGNPVWTSSDKLQGARRVDD